MIRNAALASRFLNRPLALLPSHAAMLFEMIRSDAQPMALLGGPVAEPRAYKPYPVIDGVAVVSVSGCLVHGYDWYSWGPQTAYERIRQALALAFEDDEARAVALCIDSPGGECSGCFDLADAIYAAREIKPVWAIVDEACYSAAYALGSSAERLLVPRTGGVGSIGVIWQHTSIAGALEQAGIAVTTLTYGARKADGNPTAPFSDEAAARIQADIDTLGELFVETVARNRGIAASKIRDMQAGTFLGRAGVSAGLADDVLSADAAMLALIELVA